MIWQLFKHISGLAILLLPIMASAEKLTTDLLADADRQWHAPNPAQWVLSDGAIAGASQVFDGGKTDPAASTFLISKRTFGGNLSVSLDVSFTIGRYIGLYLDFGQESQTGIWMGTGHALAEDAPENEVERGYIKTVENGFWVVRASGELAVNDNEVVQLQFSRTGDDYSLYRDGRLIATYHKPGGYPAGALQIRLTNAKASIHRLQVESDWIR